MADKTPPETPPAGDGGGPEESRIKSIEETNTRMDGLEQKLDAVLARMTGGGQGGKADPPPAAGGGNIAVEIREQLEERDRKTQADAARKAEQDRISSMEQRLAELSETPPVPPVRRIERIMGWH